MPIFELIDLLIDHASYFSPKTPEEISVFSQGKYSAREIEEILCQYCDKKLFAKFTVRKKNGGYYVDMPMSVTDAVLLNCALESIPYCEKLYLNGLSKRLESFLPEYMRENDAVRGRSEQYNGTFYENLSEIIRALYPVQQADGSGKIMSLEFEYCVYNENMELVPKKSYSGALLRKVNPIKIICNNNLFYLVTFYYDNEKNDVSYINYRIDKMRNVRCTNTPAEQFSDYLSDEEKYYLKLKREISESKKQAKLSGAIYKGSGADISAEEAAGRIDNNGFNKQEYLSRSFIMFTDKTIQTAEIIASKKVLGGIIDAFGFDIDVSCENEEQYRITLYNVTETTLIHWALQYYMSSKVVAPDYIRAKISDAARTISEKYSEV